MKTRKERNEGGKKKQERGKEREREKNSLSSSRWISIESGCDSDVAGRSCGEVDLNGSCSRRNGEGVVLAGFGGRACGGAGQGNSARQGRGRVSVGFIYMYLIVCFFDLIVCFYDMEILNKNLFKECFSNSNIVVRKK